MLQNLSAPKSREAAIREVSKFVLYGIEGDALPSGRRGREEARADVLCDGLHQERGRLFPTRTPRGCQLPGFPFQVPDTAKQLLTFDSEVSYGHCTSQAVGTETRPTLFILGLSSETSKVALVAGTEGALLMAPRRKVPLILRVVTGSRGL